LCGAGSEQVNAFLHGFWFGACIVLFDGLLDQQRPDPYSGDEVLAIMSHELAHWRLSHIPKLFAFNQVSTQLHRRPFAGADAGICI